MRRAPLSDARWFKSSHSAMGDCVETARLLPRVIGVRDSRAPHSAGVLGFRHAVWERFLADAKNGRYDLPNG
ncbi:DUF397 domain-containing protein [Actinomadura monticuli]|uniref:DUF397 domain-containing protein n=1 Tax=Actinomadura monticuli TaxID=3097367 RepID=A0ABV4QJ14_9ACTN